MSDPFRAVFDAAGVDGFVHALDLDRGTRVGHRAEEPVVLASVSKIPVLLELHRRAAAGALDLRERVEVPVAGRTAGPTGLSVMRDPIAAPNTTKYSDVETTGETMLCKSVRHVRAISNR